MELSNKDSIEPHEQFVMRKMRLNKHYEVESNDIAQVFVKIFEKESKKTIWFNHTKFKLEKREWAASLAWKLTNNIDQCSWSKNIIHSMFAINRLNAVRTPVNDQPFTKSTNTNFFWPPVLNL